MGAEVHTGLTRRLLSLARLGGFRDGNQGGKLGLVVALVAVIILGMTDSRGCVR